jgi:hypothetical protein
MTRLTLWRFIATLRVARGSTVIALHKQRANGRVFSTGASGLQVGTVFSESSLMVAQSQLEMSYFALHYSGWSYIDACTVLYSMYFSVAHFCGLGHSYGV